MKPDLFPQPRLASIDKGGFFNRPLLTFEMLNTIDQRMNLTQFLETFPNQDYAQLADTQKPRYTPSNAARKYTEFDLLEMRAAIHILDHDLPAINLTEKFALLVYTVWSNVEAELMEKSQKKNGQTTEETVARMFSLPTQTVTQLLTLGDRSEIPLFDFFNILDLARKMRVEGNMLETNAGLLYHVKKEIIKEETDRMTWDEISRRIPKHYTVDAPNMSAKGDRVRLAVTDLITLGEIYPEKQNRVALRRKEQIKIINAYRTSHPTERVSMNMLLEEMERNDMPVSRRTLQTILREIDSCETPVIRTPAEIKDQAM